MKDDIWKYVLAALLVGCFLIAYIDNNDFYEDIPCPYNSRITFIYAGGTQQIEMINSDYGTIEWDQEYDQIRLLDRQLERIIVHDKCQLIKDTFVNQGTEQ